MVKQSTLLVVVAVAVVAFVGLAYFGGSLFQVGGFNTPACFYYKFGDAYNATFTVSLQDAKCTQQFGATPYIYKWDFGDGKPSVTTTNPSVTHSYPITANTYNMIFTVNPIPASQPCGNSCPYTEVRGVSVPGQPGVVVGNAPGGTVGGSYTVTSGFTYRVVTGRVVQFDGGASGGATPYTFHWDFGDGTKVNDTGGTVTHTYAADGSYTATMSVTDANGKASAPSSATMAFSNGACTSGCGGSGASGPSAVLIIQIVLVAVGAVIAVAFLLVRKYRLAIIGVAVAALALLVPYLVR